MPRGRGIRLAMGSAALLPALVLAASWFLASKIAAGHASVVTPAAAPAEQVKLTARDGVAIAGTYWPGRTANAPAVLLLHGVGASRNQTAPMAEALVAQGYAALAIDLRGHGASTITDHSYGLDEGLDARAAFDWLKARQHRGKVAVIGVSLGGAAALIGRDGPVPADALVLVAVFPDIRHAIYNRMASVLTPVGGTIAEPLLSFQSLPRYGVWPGRIAPIATIRDFTAPVLVIGGASDRYTPPTETRALFEAAPSRKGLWLVPGLSHGEVSNLHDAEWARRVSGFLRGTIGAP
ncbi:alpha-beta hydrolase superfamily lysophospholipase [Sphingomonas kyeonggiensis]|uniref:Alpha-beta hydrolase superfamily lysophospholipase n=1 Tax=Sphingomonas kyeonggiensis TaxID=1268553 RepID=A0A7W7JZJ7_9SPHN|nr:alpha/beta fold hydrolase [Sphingomonas kyeonggiensis]MBB4838301.1 alpha-beta hydrolase superfamily lysophospholipase [Sphingomonas kyeonggiensis]